MLFLARFLPPATGMPCNESGHLVLKPTANRFPRQRTSVTRCTVTNLFPFRTVIAVWLG
jgi:hypothetical protein